jgi:hypothetical protein
MQLIALVLVMVLVLASSAFCATNPLEALKGLSNLNGILTAVFGVGLFGALGWIAKLKIGANKITKMIGAWSEAIAEVRKKATDPELRADLDSALERTADVLDELNLKDQAKKLRAAL